MMTFYPSTVVVGGGLGCDPGFFESLRDLVLSRPEHHPADLTIVQSALGDDAGLAGAAAWERRHRPESSEARAGQFTAACPACAQTLDREPRR